MALSSRKGFEMAIGTIIVMILGIAIIAGGVLLLRQLVNSSTEAVNKLTPDQLEICQKYLNEGQLVSVCPANQVIEAGESGVFGVAVSNKLNADQSFDVTVKIIDANGVPAPTSEITATYFAKLDVQQHDKKVAAISITPAKTAPQEVYTVLAEIKSRGENNQKTIYDSVRFFTVRVQ